MQADFVKIDPEETMHRLRAMMVRCGSKQQKIQELPQAFIQFMKMRGLDINQLAVPIPRFVRVKPALKINTEQLAYKLELKIQQIEQVDHYFWAINPSANINHCSLYQQALLYGMDYSSSIPVKCLNLQPNLRVLELCSAPGNKSMLMADLYPGLTITGVQISQNRANLMRNLIKKYNLSDRIQVLLQDATKYQPQSFFDRVLIDAQCTHQGSLKHIYKFAKQSTDRPNKKQQKLSKQQQKQFNKNNINPYTSQINKINQWTKQDFQQRFLDQYKLSHLQQLQYQLLKNGFRCVKDGGIAVYSTCSFDQSQNQKIVSRFVENQPQAVIIDASEGIQCGVGYRQGTIKGTLRFSPSVSCCGGMFICKLRKIPKKHQIQQQLSLQIN